MSRLQQVMAANAHKTLIPFITAGHPKPELTVTTLHALVEQGADVIELGIPFSDPMADGPTIQKSSERAISQGVGLDDVLGFVTEFRKTNTQTPIVLMGYLNPIERMGYEKFVIQAQQAGVDAVLMVDSPPEESTDLLALLKARDMDQIYLVAPTTTEDRRKYILKNAGGFIYYVALKGVTGAADLDADAIQQEVAEVKKDTNLPVAVGFGVKDAATATAVARNADAVVIGSALVEKLDACESAEDVTTCIENFIAPIRMALNSL
ncbi:tryptophan synthase subunit alpha [Marinicella sp. W31]|uniref:tryptophan synthase subunit alpha n=1 Tax=Marinicella sp. W31 TaxID=3023713 RepID=UPI003757B12F